jgi:hypothetical protein
MDVTMTGSDWQMTSLLTDLVTLDVMAGSVYIKECLLREINTFFKAISSPWT